jgi:cobyrinic acid a,c-diamide synthase
MPVLGPRLVIAGTHSGTGKTTIATGLMAVLRHRGLTVASAKVGPDFIDPGYHSLATHRPGRNLDAWISGFRALLPLAARAAQDSDILLVEGVMGLFDGAGSTHEASTADVALALSAPIVLVLDVAATSASVAAVVHGFATLRSDVTLSGLILNRVGSPSHEMLLREALAPLGIPILGALPRDTTFSWRDRHLGLVPVAEHPEVVRRSLDSLAAALDAVVDLEAVVALAQTAPRVFAPLPDRARHRGKVRLAVAAGPAFSFTYPDNLESLVDAGAELVPFDPTRDPHLPEAVTGLYAAGGFPEIYAEALAANTPLLADVRQRTADGLVTWAECGGLLWLCQGLDNFALCGSVPGEASMTERLTLGYRHATVLADNPVAPQGAALRGHEFHYSTVRWPDNNRALQLTGRLGGGLEGHATPTLLATYLHQHLGINTLPAERFVATATVSGGPSGTGR